MLVRADAIPVIEMVKAADAVDAEAAALWLHMGLWDTLGEMIDEARPEIDAVWKAVVAAKSDRARGILVRKALERRIEGGEIDDVVKAAAGLSLVRGYVAKAETTEQRREIAEHEARDEHGRFTARSKETSGSQRTAYDALQSLTQRDERLRGAAENVATQLQGDRYEQMRVVGNALMATGHPKAMAAGGAVRVAAEVGPSAEDVLGTHLRRVAYRYRGTEKRPDRQLVQQTKEAQAYVAGLRATPTSEAESRYQANLSSQLEGRKPGEWGKGAVAYRMAEADRPGVHLSEDQVEMRAAGDVATAYLMRQLPSQKEAELSWEAGRTPPSIGVILDRDGDVVSEAMGYQGDHYVPFDLKNLKRLQGGSYVRTRALGGPTSEDIYTGLLAGARQVTVVSRSGVFTVELDPDLRGGRRYSDKARQMIDRYSRLLDVVDRGSTAEGKPLYAHDVPDDLKRQLRREALEASDYDEDEADARYERRLRQERVKAGIGYTEEDLDRQVDQQLGDWVRNRTQAGHAPGRQEIGRAREQIRDEVRSSAREQRQQNKVERLRLNAEGYYRAMQSLRREFPFYIRDVSYESLPDFEERRRTRQHGEAPLGFGAPGAPANRTHVKRRGLVPEEQELAYPRRRKTGEEPPAEGAEVGAGPRKPKGGAPAAAGATFADTLKNERFQDHVASSAAVLRVVNQQVGDPPAPVVQELPVPASGSMDRDYASTLGTDAEFVKWLTAPGNTLTGGQPGRIARFLTEDATPEELHRLSRGLEEVSQTHQFSGAYANDKIDAFRTMVESIARARKPYADAGTGNPVLHEPNRDDPKPYPFPEIASAANETDEKFDKVRRQLTADERFGGPKMDEAFTWAEERNDARAAAQLRLDAIGFNAAVRWGNARAEARKAGEEPPPRPDDVDPDVKPADADEWAAEPEKSPAYRDLSRRQRAWAWVYTKRLRDALRGVTGGGAAPKAGQLAIESGEKSARLDTSFRRVVWHSPDDPLSQALAKRLSRRHRG